MERDILASLKQQICSIGRKEQENGHLSWGKMKTKINQADHF